VTPVRGDSVLVSGTVTEFGVGPETEITSIDEATIYGNVLPIDPITVTYLDAAGPNNDAVAERYECMLIKVNGVTSLTQGGPGNPFDVSGSTAGGPDTLRVDDLAIEESAYIPWFGDVVDVIGIIRFSGTAPFRRLQPRNWNEPPVGDIHVVSKANTSDVPVVRYATRLLQNTPNPFNPTTHIDFTLAEGGKVRVEVFDVGGRLVAQLLDGERAAGPNRVTWNGLDLHGKPAESGIYFYRLLAPNATQTRKMVLLK
jgi:hypothetical protein